LQERISSRRAIAWTIAVVEVVILVEAGIALMWLGDWFGAELAIPGSIAFALVGALIASQPLNFRLGWFLLLTPAPAVIGFLSSEYVDLIRIQHVALPFESAVWWFGNWAWTPSFGMAVGMLIVRFPDGRVPRRWRVVDWLCVSGTVLLAGGIASINFPGSRLGLTPIAVGIVYVGLLLIAAGAVSALASLIARYRRGDRELRLQLKWILLATGVVTIAWVYAAVFVIAFNPNLDLGLAPAYIALALIPISIGIAILRHRLFDIDLIINRTLVYGTVTAVLGGLFIGMIELTQQLSILYTGERSETAIVVTAFVVAGAFTPVEKWVNETLERRLKRGDAAGRLLHASATAESVVRVINPHRFARWLVEESVTGFEAEGGALYLHDHDQSRPFHSSGSLSGDHAIEIKVHHAGVDLGRLLLGRRRGGIDYSHRDLEALKRSAAVLGDALAVGSSLGHQVEPAQTGGAPVNADLAVATSHPVRAERNGGIDPLASRIP
jgi:hypothetical protein